MRYLASQTTFHSKNVNYLHYLLIFFLQVDRFKHEKYPRQVISVLKVTLLDKRLLHPTGIVLKFYLKKTKTTQICSWKW